MADSDSDNTVPERERRRFAVSANRQKASHRIRYVETGGASVNNEECTFCQGVPDLDDEPENGDEAEGDANGDAKEESDASASAENGRSRSKPSGDNGAQTGGADSGR